MNPYIDTDTPKRPNRLRRWQCVLLGHKPTDLICPRCGCRASQPVSRWGRG